MVNRLKTLTSVMYIRKVKKSESKSQRVTSSVSAGSVMYIRKVKKSESKSQHINACLEMDQCYVYP